jgi:hypothetical protein
MSTPIFVKVVMTVLFQDLSFAEYYREEADEIESDEEERRRLLNRANELDCEDLPNVDEMYEFLCLCDTDKPRFLEMIEDANCYRKTTAERIYVEGERVKISYVTTTDPDHFGYESPEEMERFVNQDPFFKSRTGGHVGNYCKFPSRDDPEDQLGELEMSADVVRVTDETGETVWEDAEESDEEPGQTHPFYMTHEDLFGEADGLSLDDKEPAPTQKWSKRFVPKPIRSAFKLLRAAL